jgi:hypothetical protein
MFEKANELKSYGIQSPFLQELIWFHRINDDQDSELLALEFFNVCASHARLGKLFDKSLKTVSHRMDVQLRIILYFFPELDEIYLSKVDDLDKWQKTISTLEQKLENRHYDFTYLQKRFDSFETFHQAVKVLRNASLGIQNSRRWTSKFLYPFSFQTLFVDLHNTKLNNDRRFFSRGGEVLYLMISRGQNAHIFKALLEEVFEQNIQNQRWNELINAFRSDLEAENMSSPPLGFLRFESHKIFDQLVDDLIALFRVNIPNNDLFYHFAIVSSFYMVHFILTVASQIHKTSLIEGDEEKVIYPIEILAPRSDHSRRASRQIYKINEELPLKALAKTLENYCKGLQSLSDKDALLKQLEDELNYSDENDQYDDIINLDQLCKNIWTSISKKAKDDLLPIHRILLKGAGLASAKKTNSYRYLASDEWLKTFVLINVSERMPFDEFINVLYEKYGFIISNKHSGLLIETYSNNDFKKNESRLFERLRALGLLESKSDGYAYVLNRYGRKGKL